MAFQLIDLHAWKQKLIPKGGYHSILSGYEGICERRNNMDGFLISSLMIKWVAEPPAEGEYWIRRKSRSKEEKMILKNTMFEVYVRYLGGDISQ